MPTLTELITDESLPSHIREQIAAAQLADTRQGAEAEILGESDVAELVGGRMKVTHEHPDGTGSMTLYDTSTGEPREGIPQYAVAKTLMKRRDGKAAFSLTPTMPYRKGEWMCYLHPDHPDRARIRSLGLGPTADCGYNSDRPGSAHLASQFDRDLHMEHRHGREWRVILKDREDAEKREQVALQREQIDAMREMASAAMGRPAVVVEMPDLPVGEAPLTNTCHECNRTFSHGGALALHKRAAHKEAGQ